MESPIKRFVHYHAPDGSLSFYHSRDERPDPEHFKPHYENGYEIYMFISGKGTYTVEGSRYELEPYSLLMMNSNELHVLNISEEMPYERIVVNISESFLPPFMLSGVDFFRSFRFRELGHNNQIKAETVKGFGLLQIFEKLQKLLKTPTAEDEFVARCVVVELLSAINRIGDTSLSKTHKYKKANHKIGELLEYINSNLDESLSLDSLSERFFLTKYHLCHIFKEETGFTINQYITYKRIHMADKLMLEGFTPTQACFMSGFNCYSNFFKAYRKLTGVSPRNGKAQ